MNIAFSLYQLAWKAALPFLARKPRIADGLAQRRLDGEIPAPVDIWIQSASAGEAYLTAEILTRLEMDQPTRLWLTSTTRQGLDILEEAVKTLRPKKTWESIRVSFIPFDKPDLIEKAVALARPRLMVLVELEMWPGLLRSLKKHGSRVLIVNGRLTPKSLNGYRLFPALWEHLAPDEICAISEADARRFIRLFPRTHIRVIPNIKFDRWVAAETSRLPNPLTVLFPGKGPRVVLGSVREEEEDQIEDIIRTLAQKNPDITLLLFPRHMHRIEAWATRLTALGIPFCRRTDLKEGQPTPRVVLWDRFGELGQAYALAQAAFVGGSLARLGGQNFLEVLQNGLIPVSGPSWENFAWVGDEIVRKGLLIIENTGKKVADRLLSQVAGTVQRDQIRRRALDYLEPMRGGTRATCERIIALRHHTQEKDDTP